LLRKKPALEQGHNDNIGELNHGRLNITSSR
jgi:hypothetical protein